MCKLGQLGPGWGSLTALLIASLLPVWLSAADDFKDIRVVHSIPKSQAEMDRLHAANGAYQCEPLGDGQPLETSTFAIVKTTRPSREANPRPAIRQNVLAVGLTMTATDRASLPLASRTRIGDYIDQHYVSIQVRVCRDWANGQLFLHHRPLAATTSYRGARTTLQFEPLVSTAVREFRSVGLFSRKLDQRSPADLRTLVLIFKNSALTSTDRVLNQFEYAFIRAEEKEGEAKLRFHLFVTEKRGAQLTYLNPYTRPTRPEECSIRGTIAITRFDERSGLFPKDSATREYRLDARRVFPMENIEAYCVSKDLRGGFYENVDTVLDVLIEQMNQQ